MKKTAQILLYHQLRQEYIQDTSYIVYIHHIWKITFQWRNLRLNTRSKIIDYAGGKYMIQQQKKQWKIAEFLKEKSYISWLKKFAKKHNILKFVIVKPSENYVFENFLKIQKQLEDFGVELEFLPDTYSFFLSHEEFRKQYTKPPIMEYFYRFMRKKEYILMQDDGQPEGGIWNYDIENRKFDRKHQKSWDFSIGKNKFLQEAEKFYDFTPNASSQYREELPIITNREEALDLLQYFIEHHLDTFGALEDAMYKDDPYVHHSLLSSSINYGFLSPREVVEMVEKTESDMNNKEWFIRQILGWREYMYHFFHFYKDSIYQENFFQHIRPLPSFFWKEPETCSVLPLAQALKEVHANNYCHHIQRLMIIGNFALLVNLDPHELNHWFFEFYTDAFEWVVTPNVLAMSQFADGGKLATKPYVASANYIHKMSDYYQYSSHNPKEKYTDDACPYNYLYWCFVADNRAVFEKGRQQFVVKNLEKIDIARCRELKERFLREL